MLQHRANTTPLSLTKGAVQSIQILQSNLPYDFDYTTLRFETPTKEPVHRQVPNEQLILNQLAQYSDQSFFFAFGEENNLPYIKAIVGTTAPEKQPLCIA